VQTGFDVTPTSSQGCGKCDFVEESDRYHLYESYDVGINTIKDLSPSYAYSLQPVPETILLSGYDNTNDSWNRGKEVSHRWEALQ
jgi:hypothetical protein